MRWEGGLGGRGRWVDGLMHIFRYECCGYGKRIVKREKIERPPGMAMAWTLGYSKRKTCEDALIEQSVLRSLS